MTTLRLLVTQIVQRYDGEYAPNVEACWDESDIELNPDGWNEELEKARASVGRDYDNVAVMTVSVPDDLYAAPAEPTPQVPSYMRTPVGQYGMRLFVGERTDGHEQWTEIADVWDEYVIDENGEGFAERFEELKAKVGADYSWLKVVDLFIPFAAVERAIAPWREAQPGTLVAPEPVRPEPSQDAEPGLEL